MTRLICIATGREVLPGDGLHPPWSYCAMTVIAIDYPRERVLLRGSTMSAVPFLLPGWPPVEMDIRRAGLMFLHGHTS